MSARKRIHGRPGAELARARGLKRRNVGAGRRGEQETARLLRKLARRWPHIEIHHSVKKPGGGDIDHVVVDGELAHTIDSKLWRRRSYTWRLHVKTNTWRCSRGWWRFPSGDRPNRAVTRPRPFGPGLDIVVVYNATSLRVRKAHLAPFVVCEPRHLRRILKRASSAQA